MVGTQPRRPRATYTRKSLPALGNFSVDTVESTSYQPQKTATFVTQLDIQIRHVKFMP